jgi:hypothetical protein
MNGAAADKHPITHTAHGLDRRSGWEAGVPRPWTAWTGILGPGFRTLPVRNDEMRGCGWTMCYAVVIEKSQNNHSAYVPDLPGRVASGATVEDTES